ncbi:hypothetical protein J6590_055388 [Homalodisca vitripennis]|nr:hypothetical protein J6590_055388 [Homalodisca vitripennis]
MSQARVALDLITRLKQPISNHYISRSTSGTSVPRAHPLLGIGKAIIRAVSIPGPPTVVVW